MVTWKHPSTKVTRPRDNNMVRYLTKFGSAQKLSILNPDYCKILIEWLDIGVSVNA